MVEIQVIISECWIHLEENIFHVEYQYRKTPNSMLRSYVVVSCGKAIPYGAYSIQIPLLWFVPTFVICMHTNHKCGIVHMFFAVPYGACADQCTKYICLSQKFEDMLLGMFMWGIKLKIHELFLTPQKDHVGYYHCPLSICAWLSNLWISACVRVKELTFICHRTHGKWRTHKEAGWLVE